MGFWIKNKMMIKPSKSKQRNIRKVMMMMKMMTVIMMMAKKTSNSEKKFTRRGSVYACVK